MTAMQGLSLVETKKLARFIGHQRRMLANIEAAAADFLSAFPVGQMAGESPALLLLVGSERGFCGNFNERVLAALAALPHWERPPRCWWWGIGWAPSWRASRGGCTTRRAPP